MTHSFLEAFNEAANRCVLVIAGADLGGMPEIVFGPLSKELVVIQNAGPVLDRLTLESIRYYCEEKDIGAMVVLGKSQSVVTKFALENQENGEFVSIKAPILASLEELKIEEYPLFERLSFEERVDTLTKRYLANLASDLCEIITVREVSVGAAFMGLRGTEIEWLPSVKRKVQAQWLQHLANKR